MERPLCSTPVVAKQRGSRQSTSHKTSSPGVEHGAKGHELRWKRPCVSFVNCPPP